jgi:hypothetical protein
LVLTGRKTRRGTMRSKILIGLGLILCLTLTDACASTPAQEALVKEKAMATSTIPADVSYEVIDTYILPGIKRQLDVRLNKKVSEDVLREIALKLKSAETQSYERTFIFYYLADMAIGAGAWATTHFNPTLEVRIFGLTIQEEQALITEPTPSDRQVIGSWLDEYSPSQITIYREGDTLYMEQKFKDGSSLKEELVEKPSPFGQRFDLKEGSSFGDHWVINLEGNLEILDNTGLISTAKRIQ